MYAARPCRPPSRPNPDSRYPPNGLAGSNLLYVLAHTTPARRCCAIQRIRLPLSVQTPADSPYGVLFAFVTASCGVRNVSTDSTGPKISSVAIRCDWLTPVKTVGANQKPRAGSWHGGDQRSAPSASPAADSSRILSSCWRELIAPISVFLSSGSPSLREPSLSLSRPITASATDSWTSSREPAQQTWPWLKKMPLTIPSTAASIGASSNTTLAALPPSSRVSFLPVPATARWISLPTSVEPVNAILSTPGCATRAWPVAPSPVRMLTVPGGRPASAMTSASSS